MNAEQKRYLWMDQGTVPVTCNVVINALIAWFMFMDQGAVPMWGAASVMMDSAFTLFLMTAINVAIITAMARRAGGSRPALLTGAARENHAWMQWWPAGLWPRAALLGLLATAVLLPLFWLIFWLAGITELTPAQMVAFKAAYVLALTAVLLPATAWSALCDCTQQPLIGR